MIIIRNVEKLYPTSCYNTLKESIPEKKNSMKEIFIYLRPIENRNSYGQITLNVKSSPCEERKAILALSSVGQHPNRVRTIENKRFFFQIEISGWLHGERKIKPQRESKREQFF